MAEAARLIARVGDVKCRLWEDLHIGGRLVIDEILGAIDESDVVVCELTMLNPNVLFELGYAIGKGKHVYPLLDQSVEDSRRRFEQTRLISTVGFAPYSNSEDIFASFVRERPDLRHTSLYGESIEPALRHGGSPSLFHVTGLHNDNARGALGRVVANQVSKGLRLSIADPRETAVQPLVWYAQQAIDAAAVVIHLESLSKLGADIHNARCSLLGGFCLGLGKPVLMLAPDDYSPPFDYKDLLFVYSTISELTDRATYWLTRELEETHLYLAAVAANRVRRGLATELRTLQLGEPVAENEAAALFEYFLPTEAYHQVMSDNTAVYVGRRGTGKTATMLEAARHLSDDRRNLVCTVTPLGYQMEALARLLSTYREQDTRGYLVEAIWRFLLYSEIALAIMRDIGARPAGLQPNGPEWELSLFLEGSGADLKADFDIRLERAIRHLEAAPAGDTLEAERSSITEALYRAPLNELRGLLEGALESRDRVIILIDNLDRAWDQKSDLKPLAYLLLGLLSSVPRMVEEMRRGGGGHRSVNLSAAVFIRTDIYGHLVETALEPDKIPVHRMLWGDPAHLLEVVNQRYEAAVGHETVDDEFWDKYVCSSAHGQDAQDYILGRVLPRPRDILTYIHAAIDAASLRHSPVIDVPDLEAADQAYSQFAFDAIKIEDPSLGGKLEDAFIEFAGGPADLNSDELAEVLEAAGVASSELDAAILQLREISFLGIEVKEGSFDFSEDLQSMKRADVMSRRIARARDGSVRYRIHSAFRPYLGIHDPLG